MPKNKTIISNKMQDNSLVSVIIPAYNRAKLLPNSIASIQAQTYTNWECIIVDDFSTDNTKELVESLIVHDSRIKYFTNERIKGAQGARNTGILQAKGGWIAFNDSDDEWVNDKLEKQLNELYLNNFRYDIVIHGDCIVFNHSANTYKEQKLLKTEGESPYNLYLKGSNIFFPAILTSRKALLQINLLDESVPSYQEWDTVLQLSQFCKFVHIQEPLFIYHIHNLETISKDLHREISGVNFIRDKYKRDFINNYSNKEFVQIISINFHKAVVNKYWNLAKDTIRLVSEILPYHKKIVWYGIVFFRINPSLVLKYKIQLANIFKKKI